MRELKMSLRALADVSRLRIVQQLSHCEEVSVSELARHLRLSQPLLSWHLSSLRRARLVNTRREGRVVYCSLNVERLLWCQGELGRLAGGVVSLEGHGAAAVGPPPTPAGLPRAVGNAL
jgi:ArsR family transcriptional regulator